MVTSLNLLPRDALRNGDYCSGRSLSQENLCGAV